MRSYSTSRIRELYGSMQRIELATVTVATGRIASATAQIDPSHSPDGANVHPKSLVHHAASRSDVVGAGLTVT